MADSGRAELINPTMKELQANPSEQLEENQFQTENLRKLNGLADQLFAASKKPEGPVSLENFEKATSIFTRNWGDFVKADGNLDAERIKQFADTVVDQKRNQQRNHQQIESSEKSLDLELKDLRALCHVESFFRHFATEQLGEEKAENLLKSIEGAIDSSIQVSAQELIDLADNWFRKDALASTKLPIGDDSQDEHGQNMFAAFRELAVAAADPDLKKDYKRIITRVGNLAKGHIYSSNTAIEESNYGAVAAFLQIVVPYEAWDKLEATTEQIRNFYDFVQEPLFRELFRGGHESWNGTYAAGVFYRLRDPRALPGLVNHLRRYGSGHTSAIVADTITEIVKNPLSKEDLDTVIAGMDELTQKIILNWFSNPDSLFHRIGNYNQAVLLPDVKRHFALETLANIADKIAKSKGIEIDDSALSRYFCGNFFETDQIEEILTQNPNEVAELVVESKMASLRSEQPRLFHTLVNPQSGDYFYFPKLIAHKGIGISDQSLSKLQSLYQSRELQRGVMDRNQFADGLLFLSARDDGREILEALLSKATGARADTRRLREIFSLMQNLESFGGFVFSPKVDLAEIAADLKEQLVVKTKEKMDLDEEDVPYLREGMERLAQSGLFEVVPTLLRTFNSGHRNAYEVTKQIGKHIIRGDFKNWRNNLETAREQLAMLDEAQRNSWLEDPEEVKIDIQLQSDKERLTAAVEAIKRVGSEAKAHLLEVYKLEFTPERLAELERTSSELVKSLKSTITSNEEKRELGIRKRSIDAEIRIVDGFLRLDNLNTDTSNMKNLPEIVSRMKTAMETIGHLEQPINDIDQIAQVITTQRELATVSTLRAYDTDDPMLLLNVGMEPRETCQSWRHGSYNYCLPAYVVDANKRAINVENEKGEVVARSVIKLTHIETDEGPKPVILIEPIYTNSDLRQIYEGVVRVALNKARKIGAGVLAALPNEVQITTGADNVRTEPILAIEGKKLGFNTLRSRVNVFIPRSYNTWEYSDTLGGAITWFDTYVPTTALVVST